jgi:hypothetical protein
MELGQIRSLACIAQQGYENGAAGDAGLATGDSGGSSDDDRGVLHRGHLVQTLSSKKVSTTRSQRECMALLYDHSLCPDLMLVLVDLYTRFAGPAIARRVIGSVYQPWQWNDVYSPSCIVWDQKQAR